MPTDVITAASVTVDATQVVGRCRAMASDVCIQVPRSAGPDARALEDAVGAALDVFRIVERACTRFDPASPLMRANAVPDQWSAVPPVLFDALVEAFRAHVETGGRFDPRVLGDLVRMGYDRSFPADGGLVAAGDDRARPALAPWEPRFRPQTHEVVLGDLPVDLGGIGKGLAVRWAADRLTAVAGSFLVEAGGDCFAAGRGPGGSQWRVGVEDPFGGPEPLAVLIAEDRACTTSSIRLRHWIAGGRPVHHLVDPRTGRPGGAGLVAVTVVGTDPALDEVWSKSLFLAGEAGISEEAERRRMAALWVTASGAYAMSPAMEEYVLWRRG